MVPAKDSRGAGSWAQELVLTPVTRRIGNNHGITHNGVVGVTHYGAERLGPLALNIVHIMDAIWEMNQLHLLHGPIL